jgi:hypothetical protein
MRRSSLVAFVLALATTAPALHAQETGPADAPRAARREPSAGDLATARTALREGLELRDSGDLTRALARLSTAFDLVPTPVTGFELGKTHMLLGHVLQAHELFKRVGRMPLAAEESERSVVARSEATRLAADLEPRIPQVRIHLTLPPSSHATVRIDDEDLVITGAVTPRALEPGDHEIVAQAGDGPEQRVKVTLAEGETKEIRLAPVWVPPKVPIVEPGVIYVPQTNPLVFVGFGGASVSLVVATLATYVALDQTSEASERCGRVYCSQEALVESARPAKFWSAFAIGAWASTMVFLTVGLVSISKPIKEKVVTGASLRLGPTGAAIEGRF